MGKRETVRNSLSANEIFDLGATLFQVLPRTLDAGKVRADLENKSRLRTALSKFFADRYAVWSEFPEAGKWVDFYCRHFGIEADLTTLHVPAKPNYLCWPIFMIPGITNNQAFDACKKVFRTWRYTDDLSGVRDIVKRPKSAYVVWVKQNIEADPDLSDVSAKHIAERRLNTLTLRERLVLELSYFDETKQHLDIENWTLCASSRAAGGGVPCVYWGSDDRGLLVSWYYAGSSHADLRARTAVSE